MKFWAEVSRSTLAAIVSVNFGEISLMRGTMPSRNLLRRYLVDALVESSR